MSNLVIASEVQLASGATLLDEGFESPVVSGYQQGTKPTTWSLSSQHDGFGYQRIGLNEGAGSQDWPATLTDKQGMDPNYTNSGAYTNEGIMGAIRTESVTYRLTVKVTYDKSVTEGKNGTPLTTNPGGDYDVYLVALPIGFDRIALLGLTETTGIDGMTQTKYRLIRLNGTVNNDGIIHEFRGTYTTDPVNDVSLKGYDLAVVIVGATASAIITNVKVELLPGARRVNWAPDQITTAAWYDAADPTTIDDTTTPGQVEQWNDKSGNNNHVTQGTPANQPTTGTRTINSLNVLDFDGSADYLSILADLLGSGAYSIFCVAEEDAGASASTIFATSDNTTNVRFEGRLYIGTDDTFRYAFRNTTYTDAISTTLLSHGTPYIFAGIRISTSNRQLWLNGVNEDSDTTTVAHYAYNETAIGTLPYSTPAGFFDGKIAEVIVVQSALSTSDRQKMEGYLAHKWGLQANLPPGHPYKIDPPHI